MIVVVFLITSDDCVDYEDLKSDPSEKQIA
jgi:hypothetical protein